MRSRSLIVSLALSLTWSEGNSALAKSVPCQSDLYQSFSSAVKKGDPVDDVVSYLKGKNVEFILADQNLRTLSYAVGTSLPQRFTLAVNNKLPSRGLITISEIMLLTFVDERLDSFSCKLAATGP